MNVLFYPLYYKDRIHCSRIYCDYQLDCLFHGLRSLLGSNCVDFEPLPIWYDTVNKGELYGKGFTVYGLLPESNIDRTDLSAKIESKYFDQIIVGIHHNIFNNHKNYDLIKRFVDYGNNVKVVCGNDDPTLDRSIMSIAPLFKREIAGELEPNLYPITFAIPEEKIVDDIPIKHRVSSAMLPNHSGANGWIIKDENEYYQRYRDAVYGITYKKGGWDSLRHYEILMNGCIPLFLDLEKCPPNTLWSFPKDLVLEAKNLISIKTGNGSLTIERRFNSDDVYIDTIYELLQWTRTFLTTKKLAQYVLENGNE